MNSTSDGGTTVHMTGGSFPVTLADAEISVTVDDAVAYLNELIELDRPAMAALIANRVPCNRALANHPTVQVGQRHGGFSVGMLGVLNGLFGVDEDDWDFITFVFEGGNLQKVVKHKSQEEWADERE